ncbi:GTP-binding protein [Erysipelotrichaceae bacterium 7770_A6]|nr:GTP-binding protein [Erysipelotrichaceae bacterium 7770_A6]
MSKVDVISGFLGAGKTTLIQKLIKDVFAGKKVVLVENEFGEIGIDGGFLQEAGITINEINGGCVCCTLQGDFHDALEKVENTYHPDHIIIEPSGVGKLSDILSIVKSVEGLELNSYSAVVDAKRCKIYHKNFKEFFDDQISTACCVTLSRTQLVSEDRLNEDVSIIRELNPDVRIITTPWDDLNGESIYEAMTGSSNGFPEGLEELDFDEEEHEHHHHDEDEHECCCGHHHEEEHECHHHHDEEEHECCHHHDHSEEIEHANEGLSEGNKVHIGGGEHEHHHHHHHHHGLDADDVFDSIGIETVNRYTEDDIREALKGLGENIVRAKGIVPATDGSWLFFDYVPGDVDIRAGKAAYTGLITVIGEHVDVENIKTLFRVK